METVKKRKIANYPFLLGLLDVIFIAFTLIWFVLDNKKNYTESETGAALIALLLFFGISLTLSLCLKKSYGACIGMIFWGLFRYDILKSYWMLFAPDWKPILRILGKSSYFLLGGWTHVLAGVLGILTLFWEKKAKDLPEAERSSLITKRSVFAIVTTFYLMLTLSLSMILRGDYSNDLVDLFVYSMGNGIFDFSDILAVVFGKFGMESVAELFESDYLYPWCAALLPSYLIYLGAHHPFSEKTNKPLCVIGTILTLIASVGVMKQFSEDKDMTWNLLLVAVSVVCIFAGYFYFCKKLPEWSYILVGCGFLIYAPLILLAILLLICYFIFKALLKNGPSLPSNSQTRKWEVVENGITYTIEERGEGKFVDDRNGYWDTNDGGKTFYRKD